jgi:beta-N-acetylhexosaminidase
MSESFSPVSRRSFLRTSSLIALSTVLAAHASPAAAAAEPPSEDKRRLANATLADKPPMRGPLRPHLAPDVSLDTKIGQMLLLGFRGANLADDSVIAHNLRNQGLGGVVLFGGNVRNAGQLRTLTDQLQAAAQLPLLIATDQEGGKIARLNERRGYGPTLSHAQLGQDNNLDETRATGAAIAQSLADGGITLNLAPVVDVAVNPDNPIIAGLGRSFSADPEIVATQAAAYIDGHHDVGLKCTLKHFPGHGSSQADTHLGFVDVTGTWGEDELLPYRRLLEGGKVDAIMTAHIFNSNLDPELPATLSPAVVNGMLREQLGYDGVVISDDMQMRAITDLFKLEKAFELAILAGVDIVAVANEITYSGSVADRFVNTVRRMLDEGMIGEDRIQQSFLRIMRLKGLDA